MKDGGDGYRDHNTDVNRLAELANYSVCFSNDIYSESKEREKNKDNIVAMNKIFLLEKLGRSRKEAINQVAKEHNECAAQFMDLYDKTMTVYSSTEKVKSYVDIILCRLYSNHIWSVQSERYPTIQVEKIDTNLHGKH